MKFGEHMWFGLISSMFGFACLYRLVFVQSQSIAPWTKRNLVWTLPICVVLALAKFPFWICLISIFTTMIALTIAIDCIDKIKWMVDQTSCCVQKQLNCNHVNWPAINEFSTHALASGLANFVFAWPLSWFAPTMVWLPAWVGLITGLAFACKPIMRLDLPFLQKQTQDWAQFVSGAAFGSGLWLFLY